MRSKARDAVVADEVGKAVWEGRPAGWVAGRGEGGGCLVLRGGWIFGVKNVLE